MDLEALKIDREPKARARRPRRSPWFGRLIMLALLAGAFWIFKKPLTERIDRLRLPRVEVARAWRPSALTASAVSGTAASGYIVAKVRAALSADTPGRIIEMNVEEGSVVKQGDVVARLYSDEYEAALRSAQSALLAAKAAVQSADARVASAEADLTAFETGVDAAEARLAGAEAGEELASIELVRVEDLAARDVETQRVLDTVRADAKQALAARDEAKAGLASAQAALAQGNAALELARAGASEARSNALVFEAQRDQAQATLDKTYVRAPFDGIVVLKDAEVGEVVSPNSLGGNSRGSVATMVDFSTLEVQVEMPETGIAAVRIGAEALIFLDAFPKDPYPGRVTRIWPTANRQKASIEVRVSFLETDERLRPEMGVRVVFPAEEGPQPSAEASPKGVMIPETALVQVSGENGVFVLQRDTVAWRPLTPGNRQAGRVAIEQGLEEGETVVISPPNNLRDGDRVLVSS